MNEFTELHNRQKSYVWRIRVDYGIHDELYHTNGFSVEGNIIVASSCLFREFGLELQSILGRRLCEDGFRRKLRIVYLSEPRGVALLEEEDGCSSDAFGIFEKDINLKKCTKVYTTTSYGNPVGCFLKATVLNDVESAGFIPPRDTDTICARYRNILRDVNPIMGNIFNLSTLRSVRHQKKYLGDLLSTIPIIACGGFPPFESGSGGPVTTLEGSIVGMLSTGHNENREGVAIHATFIERCIEYYRAGKIKKELVIKEDKKGKHKKNRENRKRPKKSNEDKKGGSRKSQKQHTYGGKTRSTVLEGIEETEMIKYSNKEIFLRELVSKASDALDKIRFKSSTDKRKPGGQPELCIHIIPDKAKSTLTIIDSGFRMTKADLVNNLGTIARSGAIEFMEALASGADVSMICQFGIGFFSAYDWESQAGRSFTITKDTTGEVLGGGTKITLYLKEEQLEYLKECRLTELVKKHSEFISYPISLWGEKTIEKEISDDEDREDKKDEEGKVEEVDEEKETEEKNKKIKEISHDEAVMNKQTPIWMRNPEEITKQEFTAFYKKPTIVWEEHLAVKHFSVEGKLKFKAVLFVPKRSPFDLFDNKILMKECLEMIFEIAENKDYNKFCEAFSKNLKLGIHEDSQNKTEIADFLCYHSAKSGDAMTSLKYYITRIITGESKEAVENSPFLMKLKKIGYEVLYMVDAIDGYAVGQLKEFDGKKLVSAAKEGLKLNETEDEKKKKGELKEQFEYLCKVINDVLGEKVKKVAVSGRVVGAPFSLVIGEYGWTANMERIMKAQALRYSKMKSYMASKKTMEINPENEIMDELRKRADADKNNKPIQDLVLFVVESAFGHLGLALMIPTFLKLGLTIDDYVAESDADKPALEETEADAEGSKMEEVHQIPIAL